MDNDDCKVVKENKSEHENIRILFKHDGKIYEKIKILGVGSFGSVFLCRKQSETRCKYVALKMINVNSLKGNQIDLAVNEIKILSIMKHDNIIKYYGSFIWKNKFYIEMEYADAGTLASFLNSLQKPLEEFEILTLFIQIVSAVVYLHQNNVIHRDIKTKNIFLTKSGFIKLGDFGISKILDNNKDARSFVGTPFYICPEICEGKNYNKPCDMWSLGCLLYEMSTLSKTFEENILSALMQKIVKGSYLPLNDQHSKNFQKLVHDLLQKNPKRRPTAPEVLEKVTDMLSDISKRSLNNLICYPNTKNYENYDNEINKLQLSYLTKEYYSKRSSYLYHMDLSRPKINLFLIEFPEKIQINQIAKGETHYLALTIDNQVYSWGLGQHGELGQGKETISLQKPKLISSLRNYSIIKIGCGKGFSIFIDKNGLVLTCGNHLSHCLGNGEKISIFRPSIINLLLETEVTDMSCSQDHVIAVSSDGLAYGWGSNSFGKLGLQTKPNAIVKRPTCISIPDKIKHAVCGTNATAFIDYSDQIWVCGDNRCNKLALDRRNICGYKTISMITKPSRCHIKGKVQQILLGKNHSMFIMNDSTVIAAGCNENAQLGLHHNHYVRKPTQVFLLKHEQKLKSIKVGTCFTLILSGNSLYFLGTRKIKLQNDIIELDTDSNQKQTINDFIIGECDESVMEIVKKYGPDFPIIKVSQPKIVIEKIQDLKFINNSQQIILFAQSILNLYSTKSFQKKEIKLNDFYCFENDEIFIIIDSIIHDNIGNIETVKIRPEISLQRQKSESQTKHVII